MILESYLQSTMDLVLEALQFEISLAICLNI